MITHCVITRRVHTDVSAWKAIAMPPTFLEKSVMTSMNAMKVHSFISSQLLYCSGQRTKKTLKSFDKKLFSDFQDNFILYISLQSRITVMNPPLCVEIWYQALSAGAVRAISQLE